MHQHLLSTLALLFALASEPASAQPDQLVLDGFGVDIFAAPQDGILFAALHHITAVFPEGHEIAGMKETLFIEGDFIFLLRIEISPKVERTPHDHLTDLSPRDFPVLVIHQFHLHGRIRDDRSSDGIHLDFFGAAYGLKQEQRDQVINDVLTLTDMDGRRDSLISGLSRGMQQRVSLARVLVNDPDLLLLDEPASGLDPRARIELMEILQELKRMGKTIFMG